MQIAFDDGGFALDDEEKPSLNITFDTDDAWDDTEILQIFDAAVRSHVTKGQPSKNKNKKENSSGSKEAPGAKKSRLDVTNDHTQDTSSSFQQQQQSSSTGPSLPPHPSFPANLSFTHPMPPIFQPPQQPQRQPHSQSPQQSQPQQPAASQQFSQLAGLSSPEFDTALSDMLMAWYQSGYATGKFYTLLEQEQRSQQQQAEWWQQYNSSYYQQGGEEVSADQQQQPHKQNQNQTSS